MTHPYSEDTLVERPAIALFGQLGWETANCFDEVFGVVGRDVPPERLYGDAAAAGPNRPYLGRETPAEVVLRPRLAAALARLNPDLPLEALALAVEELCRDRSALSPVEANREIYDLLRDGVRVSVPLALQGEPRTWGFAGPRVRVAATRKPSPSVSSTGTTRPQRLLSGVAVLGLR